MSDFSLSDALENGVERAHKETKVLCDWLPDPKICESCGAYTDATEDFVAEQAMIVEIWECPECGDRYYRDGD